MKRLSTIIFTFLAALIIMALPAVPHHHHHGEACLAHAHCDADDADNDCHTAHHDDGTHCFENSAFTVPSIERDETSQPFFPIEIFFNATLETDSHLFITRELHHPDCHCKDCSPGHRFINSLRAPPMC